MDAKSSTDFFSFILLCHQALRKFLWASDYHSFRSSESVLGGVGTLLVGSAAALQRKGPLFKTYPREYIARKILSSSFTNCKGSKKALIQHILMEKILKKLDIESVYHNTIKIIFGNPTTNIMLNRKKLKCFY